MIYLTVIGELLSSAVRQLMSEFGPDAALSRQDLVEMRSAIDDVLGIHPTDPEPDDELDSRAAIELTRGECITLANAAKRARMAKHRQAVRAGRVPPPGHRNLDEVHAARYADLEARLRVAGGQDAL